MDIRILKPLDAENYRNFRMEGKLKKNRILMVNASVVFVKDCT